jgi:hypothetical protein
MSMTLLQLIQAASSEMGLASPTYVVGNTNQDVTQQLALINSAGRELARQYQWNQLTKQYIVTVSYTTITGNTTSGSTTLDGIASTSGIDTTYQITGLGLNQATYVTAVPGATSLTLSQPATSSNTAATYTLGKVKYALPSDFDRQINRTHWDKSKHWEMLGPETAQQWEWLISGYISTGPRIRYRIFQNYFQIWPIVTTSEVIGFEYLSNGWVLDTSGNPKSSFSVDTDTCIYPDALMVLALKKKYFEVKGFDFSTYLRDYEAQLDIAKANDGGAATLSYNPRISTVLIGFTQIPDSGYGT